MAERILNFNTQQLRAYPDGYKGDTIIDSQTGRTMDLRRREARKIIGMIHTSERRFSRSYKEPGTIYLHIPEGDETPIAKLLTLPDGSTRILDTDMACGIAGIIKGFESRNRWSSR